MSTALSRTEALVKHLEGLVKPEGRGALAVLRRSLGKAPGAAPELYRCLGRLAVGLAPGEEDDVFLVSALFALWHQGRSDAPAAAGDLGASLARLMEKMEGDSTEKRFLALLKSPREDLPDHLRQAVSLLRSKDVPVGWAQLLFDLALWDHEDRPVQRRWARSFWGNRVTEEADETGEAESPEETAPEAD